MSAVEDKPTLLGYDIDLGELARVLRRRAWLIVACVFAALLLAVLYLNVATYKYTATLIVSPVLSSAGDQSIKASGLGGLASLAGINIGGNDAGSQAFLLYQEGIFSRDAAQQLSRNPAIMHTIFAKQWNEATGQWVPPSGVLQAIIGLAKDIVGVPDRAWQPPDAALLQDYIGKNVMVDSDPQKPVVTITYADADPRFAVQFLQELNRAVDDKLRDNDLTRANQYVDYLSHQLGNVDNGDVRQSLMVTLAQQERTKMMASSPAPYAAQPFGLPSASRKPTSPRPALVLGAALLLGALIGGLTALWLPGFQARRRA